MNWILQKDLESAEFETIETTLTPEEIGSCESPTPSSDSSEDEPDAEAE